MTHLCSGISPSFVLSDMKEYMEGVTLSVLLGVILDRAWSNVGNCGKSEVCCISMLGAGLTGTVTCFGSFWEELDGLLSLDGPRVLSFDAFPVAVTKVVSEELDLDDLPEFVEDNDGLFLERTQA